MMINKAWHNANPLPNNATTQQRIEWHEAHAHHCGCRSIPESLKKLFKKTRKPSVVGLGLDCD